MLLASLSPIKLAAARAVFGEEVRGVQCPDPFSIPQPVGDEYGLVGACLRLQAVPGDSVLSVESYLRLSPSGQWEDVVCAVLRRGGRVLGEAGEAVTVPREAAEAARDAPGATGEGFAVTAGQMLVQQKLVNSAANWHLTVAGIDRAQQIAAVLRRLAGASPQRCSALDVRANLRYTRDHPKPGVLFKDMSSLFGRAMLGPFVAACVAALSGERIDVVVGLEARGLALGALLAMELGCGFAMARKAGKLPPPVVGEHYGTEYSKDKMEMASDDTLAGTRVAVVDDLVATGGSLLAASSLVKKLGGTVVCCFCPLSVAPLFEAASARFAELRIRLVTL